MDEYGPDVLAEPEAKGFDLSAWLVPGVLVARRGARRRAAWRGAGAARPRREPPTAPTSTPTTRAGSTHELATFDR